MNWRFTIKKYKYGAAIRETTEMGSLSAMQNILLEAERNEKYLLNRRYYGSGKNCHMPDFEKEIAGLCISGWGLVLGYAAFPGNIRDEKDGNGEYLFPVESVYSL